MNKKWAKRASHLVYVPESVWSVIQNHKWVPRCRIGWWVKGQMSKSRAHMDIKWHEDFCSMLWTDGSDSCSQDTFSKVFTIVSVEFHLGFLSFQVNSQSSGVQDTFAQLIFHIKLFPSTAGVMKDKTERLHPLLPEKSWPVTCTTKSGFTTDQVASKKTQWHQSHLHLLHHMTGLNLSFDLVFPSLGVWTHSNARVPFSLFLSVSLH